MDKKESWHTQLSLVAVCSLFFPLCVTPCIYTGMNPRNEFISNPTVLDAVDYELTRMTECVAFFCQFRKTHFIAFACVLIFMLVSEKMIKKIHIKCNISLLVLWLSLALNIFYILGIILMLIVL